MHGQSDRHRHSSAKTALLYIYIYFRDTFVRYQLIGLYVVVVQSSLQTVWRRAMDAADAADAADDDDDEDNDGDAAELY